MISSSMIIMIGVIIIIIIIGSGNDRFVEVPPQRIHQATQSWCGRTEKYHNQKKTTHSFPSSVFEISSRFSHFIWLKKNGRYAGPCYLKEFYWTRWSPPSQPLCSLASSFTALKYDFEKKPGFLGHVVVIMENLMDMCTLQEKSILNLISNPGILQNKALKIFTLTWVAQH